MNGKLPTRLSVEPIIDAIMEVRFSASIDASLLLPGLLLQKFGPDVKVEKLPLSEMPESLRQQDPGLRFHPVVRVFHGGFIFLIGTGSVGVGCLLPYPGWVKFREVIRAVIDVLNGARIVDRVLRYSLKYVDLLEFSSSREAFEHLNVSVHFAGVNAADYPLNIGAQIPEGIFIHAIQVGSPAHIRLLDGREKTGTVLTIDTLVLNEFDFGEFVAGFEERIDAIHLSNKAKFFSFLNDDALKKMGATYE